MRPTGLKAIVCCLALTGVITMGFAGQIQDKTLVVWVAPANLDQHAGSALTLDDGQSHFDGIVFGEIAPQKWMPGSDFYTRSTREQASWPRETSRGSTFVQIAIVYKGHDVTAYRNGVSYAHYSVQGPPLSIQRPRSIWSKASGCQRSRELVRWPH